MAISHTRQRAKLSTTGSLSLVNLVRRLVGLQVGSRFRFGSSISLLLIGRIDFVEKGSF